MLFNSIRGILGVQMNIPNFLKESKINFKINWFSALLLLCDVDIYLLKITFSIAVGPT